MLLRRASPRRRSAIRNSRACYAKVSVEIMVNETEAINNLKEELAEMRTQVKHFASQALQRELAAQRKDEEVEHLKMTIKDLVAAVKAIQIEHLAEKSPQLSFAKHQDQEWMLRACTYSDSWVTVRRADGTVSARLNSYYICATL